MDWTLVVLLRHESLGISFPGIVNEDVLGKMIAAALNNGLVKAGGITRAEANLKRALDGTTLPASGSRKQLYAAAFKEVRDAFPSAAAVLGNTGVYNEFVLCPDFPHEIHHFTGTGKQLVEHIRTVGVK
jgi:hypothetical protein